MCSKNLSTTIKINKNLHIFQTSIKESSEKIEKSQVKITEVAQNLTNQINSHTHLLEKVNMRCVIFTLVSLNVRALS